MTLSYGWHVEVGHGSTRSNAQEREDEDASSIAAVHERVMLALQMKSVESAEERRAEKIDTQNALRAWKWEVDANLEAAEGQVMLAPTSLEEAARREY